MGGFAPWSLGEIVYGCSARVAYMLLGEPKQVVLPLNPRNQWSCFGWQLTMGAASMHGLSVLPRDWEAKPLTHHLETAEHEVWSADGDLICAWSYYGWRHNAPGTPLVTRWQSQVA